MTPDPLLVLLVAAAYLGLLFGIARFADQRADAGRSVITANVYALSLAVYCTSWTFYGSVGRATSGGLSFLTIYLGPTLMLLCIPVWLKVLRISKAQRLTSIADFIAARYGMSQRLAGCVTVIAVIGIVPYIALQLKAISASFQVLFGTLAGSGDLAWWQDSTAWIAVILALFTILFGTRHLDAAERHEGMVAAVAFESVVKLFAFLAIGLFVVFSLFDGPADLFRRAASLPATARLLGSEAIRPVNWLTLIFLSGLAILLLPRQFQIAIVENKDESHLLRAVWLFPLYLLLINLFVLPVALGGMLHFGHAGNSDLFVLSLPLARGQETLALLAFVGGLSAATGMVIVETIALSTMLCNDLVMPVLLRSEWSGVAASRDMSQLLLRVRRGAIALILGLGYIYFRAAGEAYALVGIGLISFSAVAQFAPALFGGLYWKQATHRGALAGLLAGFTVWLYTLLLPSFARSGWIDPGFVEQGLFGWPALKAQALFGLSGIDEISHCLFWSLLANFAAYIGISLYSQPGALEARQANLFVDALRRRDRLPTAPLWRGNASVEALAKLLERFLGPARAEAQLLRYGESRGLSDWRSLPADAGFVHFAEVQLAGAIGSASARVMVASAVQEEELGLDEVLDILDEASQVRAYSRELEQKSRELEAATGELRDANTRLLELDRMKDDFISTVTHELRTPLTSIRAFSELLYDDPEIELDDRKRFLGIIVAETERLTRLINQILDLAKLESGRAEWTPVEMDLCEVVSESMAAMEQLYRDKGVSLDASGLDAPLRVMADRDRLIQVMVNLLSNAVKFVASGKGKVDVRLERQPGQVRLTVQDNGPGIRAEDRERIFEKFRQGGNTLTDKPQGTGLGLPISRQIVEYFGGRLWVESEEGQGASFVFTLPLPATHIN